MTSDLLDQLVCPVDGSQLCHEGPDWLVSEAGRRYPVVQGVPVLLRDDVPDTLWVASASREAATAWAEGQRPDSYFVGTLGLSADEREGLSARLADAENGDPVISFMLWATNGNLYQAVTQQELSAAPIPTFRLTGRGESLLDVGCNWGRWVVAAGRAGFSPVGVDPSLGGVLAGKRLCESLGIQASFVVGDSRHLPFRKDAFGTVHSYSVLQHLSRENATRSVAEMARVLGPDGTAFVQMPNRLGIRCLQHQARRWFREAEGFEVRYWSLNSLRKLGNLIGPTVIEIDGFFGLGIQPSDRAFMGTIGKTVVTASERLRHLARIVHPLVSIADSVYIRSQKPA